MGDEKPAHAAKETLAHAGKEAPAQELVLQLLEAVSEEPGAEWVDEAVCVRYLMARNNHLDKATAMLKESLRWRHSFGVSKLGERHVIIRRESETGKLRVSDSVDRSGRTVLVMTPRAENTSDHDGQLLNLVYHLEGDGRQAHRQRGRRQGGHRHGLQGVEPAECRTDEDEPSDAQHPAEPLPRAAAQVPAPQRAHDLQRLLECDLPVHRPRDARQGRLRHGLRRAAASGSMNAST